MLFGISASMSLPREIVPGATYFVTRRTMRQHLLFRPDAAMNELLTYVLAIAANRYGIQVHAVCAMSNHVHLIVTDVHGILPRFLHFFHRIVALGTKMLRRWEGPVWDHQPTSVVRLLTPAALVEKIAYVLANPVAAGLVQRAHEWPGTKVCVDDIGSGILCAKRPTVYLDPANPCWSEEAVLHLELPPTIRPVDAEAFRARIAAELERQELEAHMEVKRSGRRFWGVKRVCSVSPHDRIPNVEPVRQRNPTFAVGRNQGSAWRRAAAAVRTFRRAYREALERWRGGVRTAVFPTGTWWMRIFHGARAHDFMDPARLSLRGRMQCA